MGSILSRRDLRHGTLTSIERPAQLGQQEGQLHSEQRVRAAIASLAADGLEWGPCHHDMTFDNVRVTDAGKITFFDFDSGGPGWRALDFQGVYDAAVYERDDSWDAFLAGYREARPIGARDLAAVPYFVLAYAFWGVHMDIVRATWHGIATLTDEYFDARMGPAGWWRRWDQEQLGGE